VDSDTSFSLLNARVIIVFLTFFKTGFRQHYWLVLSLVGGYCTTLLYINLPYYRPSSNILLIGIYSIFTMSSFAMWVAVSLDLSNLGIVVTLFTSPILLLLSREFVRRRI
jgi:hypothetical protein